jgi:hypothetical protein
LLDPVALTDNEAILAISKQQELYQVMAVVADTSAVLVDQTVTVQVAAM